MSPLLDTVRLTLIELANGRVHARIDQSPFGTSDWPGHEFDVPAGKDWFDAFMKRWLLEGAESTLDVRGFGSNLYNLVFGSSIQAKFDACRYQARQNCRDLRLAINVSGARLSRLPFETLHDGKGFLVGGGVRIVRVFDEIPPHAKAPGPLRNLLVALAAPGGGFRPWGLDKYLEELQSDLKIPGLNVRFLPHVGKQALLRALRRTDDDPVARWDALYLVAHGQTFSGGDTELFLEDAGGMPEPLPANLLAEALRANPGCLVYLNSCSTALAPGDNLFAGAAQRLMLDGGVAAVLAMQKPIRVERALPIAAALFRELAHAKSFEEAARWASDIEGDGQSWAIPCLHTHLATPFQERRNRLAAFFRADPDATFAFYLPIFRMGIPPAKYYELADRGEIHSPPCYHYKGETHSRSDVIAAMSLHSLLLQMLAPDHDPASIHFDGVDAFKNNRASHVFCFGSKSHEYVANLLTNYSRRFAMEYSDEIWGIRDLAMGKKYEIRNPSRTAPGSQERENAMETDYAVIEKLIDPDNGRVYFVIAGLQDRGTRGAGEYVAKHWEELVEHFGSGAFRVLLQFAPGLDVQGLKTLISEAAS